MPRMVRICHIPLPFSITLLNLLIVINMYIILYKSCVIIKNNTIQFVIIKTKNKIQINKKNLL